MVGDPALWDELCARLARLSAHFLRTQVDAGRGRRAALRLVGGQPQRRRLRRLGRSRTPTRVLAAVTDVPRIHFGVGTGELLGLMGEAGAEVVGVDWRIPLATATDRLGPAYAVQGNLDPALLGAPWPVVEERVREAIRSGAAAPGHIFNLGPRRPARDRPRRAGPRGRPRPRRGTGDPGRRARAVTASP